MITGNETLPPEQQELSPLLTTKSLRTLRRLQEHEHAPRWNHRAGDRVSATILEQLNEFRSALSIRPIASSGVPDCIIDRVAEWREVVPLVRRNLESVFDIPSEWECIPTMSREDIASNVELLVPDDAPLEEMIVYRTAGTTGHSLLVPHHPRSAACYQPFVDFALSECGVKLSFMAEDIACFLVGAQARTVTYPTVLSYWNGAGFAKINLSRREWRSDESAGYYLSDMAPAIFTGDPISFSELMKHSGDHSPRALVSTAVAMSDGLREMLQEHFRCPVIDWYSLTETGPIGYRPPGADSYRVMASDIFIEAVREDGTQVSEGERGEIVITGGRNPFVPLLRYRTGDWGAVRYSENGEVFISELEGRAPVVFRSHSGALVNPVDISGVIRSFPLVQHEFVQKADRSCELQIRPAVGADRFCKPSAVQEAIEALFDGGVDLSVIVNSELGQREDGKKAVPYRSELLLED
jgi:phenylacetate-CoA ligase